MPSWIIHDKIDLAKEPPKSTVPYALMFPEDQNAHTWQIEVFENGVPVNMGGGSVVGYFQRVDGNTLEVSGSISAGADGVQNLCSVSLPQTAYAYPGILLGGMRHTKSNVTTTIGYKLFNVLSPYDSGSYISPGSTIPNIDQLEAMIANMEYAIRYDSTQSLSTAEKQQAAENTGAVSYFWDQELTSDNQQAARNNIGMDFIDRLNTWTNTQRYTAKQNLNIPIIEPIYDPTHSYEVGDTCTYLECCYVCHTATTGTEQDPVPFSWDDNWTYISLRAQTLWYTPQYLSAAQKNQSRLNIGAAFSGITPEMYGAVGDGTTDDTNALLEAFTAAYNSNSPLVLTYGRTYTTTRELQIYGRITIFGNGAIIKATASMGNVIYLENDTNGQFPNSMGKGLVTNLTVDCNFNANCGIFTMRSQGERFQDVDVCHFLKCGIRAQGGFEVFMENVRVAGRDLGDESSHGITEPTVGIIAYCSDSHFTDVVTINVDIGVLNHNPANSFTHLHAWNTAANIVPTSIMLETHFPTMIENSYIDTCAVGIKVDNDTMSNIGVYVNGLFVLHGGSGSGGKMTPEIMGNITPCVFEIPTVAFASQIKGYGINYLSPTEDYNLFDKDVEETEFDWHTNNDASISQMGNVPSRAS